LRPFGTPPALARDELDAGLDSTTIPPVEALSPVSGLDFGSGVELGPLTALLDGVAVVALVYVVRRHRKGAADQAR
jgi:hypothetical protein